MSEIIEQLGLSGWDMLFHALNFLILFVVLFIFLYKPISKMVKKRKETLESIYTENERLNNEALEIKRSYEDALEATKQEVAKLSIEATATAEAKARSIIEAATIKAADMLKGATKELEGEEQRLTQEFKSNVSSLSVEIASKILEREVSAKDNAKIIDEALSRWALK